MDMEKLNFETVYKWRPGFSKNDSLLVTLEETKTRKSTQTAILIA